MRELRSHNAALPASWLLGSLLLGSLLLGCGGSRPALEQDPLALADSTSAEIEQRGVAERDSTRVLLRAHWERAHALALHDSLDAARTEVDRALALDSLDAPSLVLFSDLEYRRGRHAEAIPRLERACKEIASCPLELTASLALHLAANGETARADSLLAPRYEDADSWKRIGSVLAFAALRSEHPERLGPRAAELALEADESPINLNNQGIALLIKGEAREARQIFERAHELAPKLPGPLYNLAIVERFYFRNDVKAREWFERYLALSDSDPDGLKSVLAPDRAGGIR